MEKYFEINKNGLNIKSKLFANEKGSINKAVISVHGFGGNKENKASKSLSYDLLKKYPDIAVIAFDWPCHGKDVRQKLDLDMCDNYLDTVINYIKEDLGVNEIYLQGTSFGGYLTFKYIQEHGNPFNGIALRCPAINMYDVLTGVILNPDQLDNIKHGKIEEAGFEKKIKIDSKLVSDLYQNDIQQYDYNDISDSVLIMHGTKDEVVPFEKDKLFCENNNIDFLPIKDADHRYSDPAKLRECLDWIESFYQDCMEKSEKKNYHM